LCNIYPRPANYFPLCMSLYCFSAYHASNSQVVMFKIGYLPHTFYKILENHEKSVF